MKKLIIILVLWMPLLMNGQESKLHRFFDECSGKEGYTSVYITKYTFDLFARITDETDEKEFHELTSKLNSVKILTADAKKDFTKQLSQLITNDIYHDLMIVKDGKQTVRFLVNEKQGKISELVMIVTGEDETVLMFLEGEIDLKNISKLSKSMNINGFEYLDKIDKNENK